MLIWTRRVSQVKAAQSIGLRGRIPELIARHQHLVVPANAGTYTPPVRFVRDDETTRAQQGRCLWVPAFAGTTRGEGGCNHPTFRLLDTPLSRGMTKDDRTAHLEHAERPQDQRSTRGD